MRRMVAIPRKYVSEKYFSLLRKVELHFLNPRSEGFHY